MRILRAEGRAAAPWSNGGGVTREIAVQPPGSGWDTFAWRVSLADVTRDGPYSPLPGVRRILTVVDGAGLELTVDGTTWLLPERYRPFAFPGGAATGSRLLDGRPVVNLNVMLREGRAAATVEMVRGSRRVWPADDGAAGPDGCPDRAPDRDPDEVMVVAVEGCTRLGGPGDHEARLGRFDVALLTAPDAAAAALWTDGTAAVIALSVTVPGRS
ncbi:HutD/Ves family protein [Streptomyces lydicus]|uniref:HutD/Ves family protein n=1 Tax=Streptomyces lydicus TaxID=47763 RepID=UPI00101021C7|nr:HutD family protein [Streptomyces lydicus]MCZ1007523.1 HutD family protein [Streptomyces lydicus]